jgi:hypothetical protein
VIRRLLVLVMLGLLTAGCTSGPMGPVAVTPLSPSNSPTPSPNPSLSPSPSPSTSPSVQATTLPIGCDASGCATPPPPPPLEYFPGSAHSATGRITFTVSAISPDNVCALHRYPSYGNGKPVGAFYSHCSTWDRPLYFFFLRIENGASQPLPLSLTELFVVDRDGGSHQPVDETDVANQPGRYLSASTNVAPHAALAGWVTLDASQDFTPRRFQLAVGNEVLTVRFRGQETILPGGTLTGE